MLTEHIARGSETGAKIGSSLSKTDKLISVVLPVHNEEGNLAELYRRLVSTLEPTPYRFELLFIDDGSVDGSLQTIKALARQDCKVRYISLSRNFGHQAALTVGIDYAHGDAIILMDSDLQHPPELIPGLLKHWEDGHQIVYTIRKTTHDISFFKKSTADLFYKIVNLVSQVQIDPNSSDFRLIDRKVQQAIKQNPESERFYRGMMKWVGFRQKSVEFDADKRFSGTSSYTLVHMIRFAISGILSYSFIPLLVIITFAMLNILFSAGYLLFVFYQKFISAQALPGQTSILVTVLMIGNAQLLASCITALYAYKSYHEAKKRPIYVIGEMGESDKK